MNISKKIFCEVVYFNMSFKPLPTQSSLPCVNKIHTHALHNQTFPIETFKLTLHSYQHFFVHLKICLLPGGFLIEWFLCSKITNNSVYSIFLLSENKLIICTFGNIHYEISRDLEVRDSSPGSCSNFSVLIWYHFFVISELYLFL